MPFKDPLVPCEQVDDPLAGNPQPPARPVGPDDFALDADLIKVLASDSRRDILRLLKQRRMTLTELATALRLKKATVLEHLKRLTDANLIKRIDDERLWVYYELTSPGRRVVNPGRTRFYLLMGVAAAALVLGGVAAAAWIHEGPSIGGSPRTSEPLGVQVSDADATASGLGVSVRFANDTTSARAYLLNAEEAEQLRHEHRVVGGIPLALADSRGDLARFTTQSPVPGGTYFVYVVDAQGRDNVASLESVSVPTLVVQGPRILWRGVDGDAAFRVTRDSNATNGTLLLVASEGHELPTLPVENGSARLDAATLDRLVPADYAVQFLPVGSQFWITTSTHVDVREPIVSLSPLTVAEGQRAALTLGLSAPGSEPAPDAAVLLDGSAVAHARPTATTATFVLAPHAPGAVDVQFGRLLHRQLVIEPDATLSFRANDTRLNFTATRGQEPLAGALLKLDGVNLGTTDQNGNVTLGSTPIPGVHALTLIADGAPVLVMERAVAFDGFNVSAPRSTIDVRDVRAAPGDGTLSLDARLDNPGPVPQRGTLTAFVDGAPVFSQPFDVARNATSVNVSLAFGLRLGPGDHAVRLAAEPLAHAPLSFTNDSSPPTFVATAPAGGVQADEGATTPSAAPSETGFIVDTPPNASVSFLVADLNATNGSSLATAFTYAPSQDGRATASATAKTPNLGLPLLVGVVVVAAVALRRR